MNTVSLASQETSQHVLKNDEYDPYAVIVLNQL